MNQLQREKTSLPVVICKISCRSHHQYLDFLEEHLRIAEKAQFGGADLSAVLRRVKITVLF